MKHKDKFELSSFVSPDVSCAPVYIWVWNDGCTRELINIQLAEMQVYNNRAEELTCEETFEAHFQTRASGENAHDARIILLTKPELLEAYDKVDVAITFTLTDGGTKVINGTLGGAASDYTLYKRITAGADLYKAAEGAAIFGNIVTDIPNGAYTNVSVTITNGSDVLYEASLNG